MAIPAILLLFGLLSAAPNAVSPEEVEALSDAIEGASDPASLSRLRAEVERTAPPYSVEGANLRLDVAAAWHEMGEHWRAIEVLENLERQEPDERAGRAAKMQARCFRDLHLPGFELDALQRALMAGRNGPPDALFGASSTVASWAQGTIAEWYERRGDWQNALVAYRGWEPATTCATHLVELMNERDFGIARGLSALGRHDEAFAVLLEPLESIQDRSDLLMDLRVLAIAELAAKTGRSREMQARVARGGDPDRIAALFELAVAVDPTAVLDIVRRVERSARFKAEAWTFYGTAVRRLCQVDPHVRAELALLAAQGDELAEKLTCRVGYSCRER